MHTDPTPHTTRRTGLARIALGLIALTLPLSARADSAATLTLGGALEGLKSTPDWLSADLNVQQAQRNLDSARAAAGLNVSARGAYDASQVTSSDAQYSDRLSVSVTASTTVLPWAPANDGVRSATRALEQAERSRRESRSSLVVSTAGTYFDARNASLDVAVADATVALQEGRLRAATARHANGQIALTDLLDAQGAVASARSSLLSAQNTRAINASTLGVAADVALTTAPKALTLPEGGAETVVRGALTRRADVLNAASRLEDAQEALANAQRDRLVPNASVGFGYGQLAGGNLSSPSVSANLNFQSGAASLTGSYPVTGGPAQGSTGYTVSLSASIPILAPSSDAKIAAAQTSLENARNTLESTRRRAALDVAGRYGDATTAAARLKVAEATLETARKTLETAQTRNQSGLNTALDLESARVNLAGAERDLEKAVAAQALAVMRLQSAAGLELSIPGGAN